MTEQLFAMCEHQNLTTRQARELGVKGVVTVHVAVQRNGTVSDVKIVHAEPPGYGFEEAVLEAAKRWKFVPALRDDVPVDGELDIVVRFR